MILALALGLAARFAFGWEPAPLLGLLAGIAIAPLVPRGGRTEPRADP